MNDAAYRFWVVWSPGAGAPVVRHESEASAIDEAERLARVCPGDEFIVLASVCSRHVGGMIRVDLSAPRDVPCAERMPYWHAVNNYYTKNEDDAKYNVQTGDQ